MTAKIKHLLLEDNDLKSESAEPFFKKNEAEKSLVRVFDGIDALTFSSGQTKTSIENPLFSRLDLNSPRMDDMQFFKVASFQ